MYCGKSLPVGRRGDRIKLLYWDGQGFCLYYQVLERGRFPWPNAQDEAARMTSAQLAMLWEGIDWRRPDWGGSACACRVNFGLYLRYLYGVLI